MEYEVDLTEAAQGMLNRLPLWLQGAVESHLLRLGASPHTLSRTVVSPPYPPGGMMSEFNISHEPSVLHHISVFFRYSQDETRLIVTAIGHRALYAGP
jgi:hypothetical protein